MTSPFDSDFAAVSADLWEVLGETCRVTTGDGTALEIAGIPSRRTDDVAPRDFEDPGEPFDRDATRQWFLFLREDWETPDREAILVYDGKTWAIPQVNTWKKSTATDHEILFETVEYVR